MKPAVLTLKQGEALQAIGSFYKKRTFMPTYRELGVMLGGLSIGATQQRVRFLIAKGYLSAGPDSRSFKILKGA